jgi:hypothetical protein
MSFRPSRLSTALIAGALAVSVATGCMTDSVAPRTQATSSARTATAQQDGLLGGILGGDDHGGLLGGSTTSTRDGDDDHRGRDGGGLLGSILNPLVKLVFQIVKIPFGQGGSVSNGRWRLDVPAGAIAGDATVGIGVQSQSAMSCQLEILPAELNHFATPVTVTATCKDIDRDKLRGYVVWWFDPMQNKWVVLESSKVDLVNGTVSAPLPHCSAYAVGPRDGKAGW